MYSVILAAMLTSGTNIQASGWGYGSRPVLWSHGCFGYRCYGCFGCYGGMVSYGCRGCWGCSGGCTGTFVRPAPTPGPAKPESLASPMKETRRSLPATIFVQFPAGTKVFVDSHPVPLLLPGEGMITPDLELGKNYSYVLKAETMRNGTKVTDTRQLVVRGGQTYQVDFGDMAWAPGESPAAHSARVTVRLPADAKLFVDGVP